MPCNPDLIDDKILTRVGASTLDYVACDGNKWQGSLKRLSYANGYKVYFSGAAGSLIQQRGKPQVPVADVRLRAGWNWIGHAPLVSYFINSIVALAAAALAAAALAPAAFTGATSAATKHSTGVAVAALASAFAPAAALAAVECMSATSPGWLTGRREVTGDRRQTGGSGRLVEREVSCRCGARQRDGDRFFRGICALWKLFLQASLINKY